MIVNFVPWFIDESTLKIVDATIPNSIDTPEVIQSMRVSLVSDKIPNGGIYDQDVNSYIYLYKKDRTIYEFTAESVGIPAGGVFEDGVYTVTLTINSNYEKEKKVCKYSIIKDQVDALLKEVALSYDINKYVVTFKSTTTKSKQDLVLNCIVLINNLFALAQVPDEDEINTILDKLNKLLLIIQNDYGKSNLY